MTPEQIRLVQRHFGQIYPVKTALAQVFYDRLFSIAPQVRDLFPDNMVHQREKLADTLAYVVKNLSNTEHLLMSVKDLAQRHRGYGARTEHFDPVGEALVFALGHHTPEGLEAPVLEAWLAAYTMIADNMAPHMETDADTHGENNAA